MSLFVTAAIPFATDPIAYVVGATSKVDSSRLTSGQKPDHVNVHQGHFFHFKLNPVPAARRDLRFELWNAIGV